MKRFLFSFVIIFLFGCQSTQSEKESHANFPYPSKKESIQPPFVNYEHYVDHTSQQVANQLKTTHNLYLCGTGGRMQDTVRKVSLCFFYYQTVDINQGRKLLLDAVHALLKGINESKQLRPYLNCYPFSPKNVEIIIYLHHPDRSHVSRGELTVIKAQEGELQYEEYTSRNQFSKTILTETYEEAVRIVQSEKNS